MSSFHHPIQQNFIVVNYLNVRMQHQNKQQEQRGYQMF